MKIDPALRDVWLQAASVIVTALVVREIARATLPEKWEAIAMISALIVVQVIMKLAMPRHAILSKVSWLYLALCALTFLSIVAVISGFFPIGVFFAALAVIGLGLALCIIHITLGPRPDDYTVKSE